MNAQKKIMYYKHSSKLYKGFLKQVKRQENKLCEDVIELIQCVNLPKNFKGVYTHTIEVSNSRWNGMNLKVLTNKLYPLKSYGGMYSKFILTNEGKVKLSRYGKEILKKKKHITSCKQ